MYSLSLKDTPEKRALPFSHFLREFKKSSIEFFDFSANFSYGLSWRIEYALLNAGMARMSSNVFAPAKANLSVLSKSVPQISIASDMSSGIISWSPSRPLYELVMLTSPSMTLFAMDFADSFLSKNWKYESSLHLSRMYCSIKSLTFESSIIDMSKGLPAS